MTEAGDVVVVSGAGRGIGRVIALHFARAGARLVLAARSAAELDETRALVTDLGAEALVVQTDVTDQAQTERMAQAALTEFGALDVLVCNSGIAGPTAPLWETDLEQWRQTFAVNVEGVFLCCRAALPAMLERGTGKVIVIGSMTGKRALHGRTPYAASKTALIGLVRTLAWEVGESGIRVNLISPGAVNGPRIEGVVAAQAQALGITEAEARARFTSASPLGRLIEADDVAETVRFLASPAAAGITGEDVNVSAGAVMY
jgi:NAD(P)-dependent dehydrogenase (short-subunit alcohol dehydrogenase family)